MLQEYHRRVKTMNEVFQDIRERIEEIEEKLRKIDNERLALNLALTLASRIKDAIAEAEGILRNLEVVE